MPRYGETMREVKILLKQKRSGDRFFARDFAKIITKKTNYPVSSNRVAQCLSKLGCVRKIKERTDVTASYQWEVQPEVVML